MNKQISGNPRLKLTRSCAVARLLAIQNFNAQNAHFLTGCFALST